MSLDPSLSSTGVAIFEGTKLIRLYTISPKTKGDARYEEIALIFQKILLVEAPDVLITENQFVGRFAFVALILGRVRGIFEGLFYVSRESKGTVVNIVTSEGKATFGAWRRKSDKELLAGKIRAIYPNVKFKNQDEIDAVAVGVTGIKKFLGKETLTDIFKNLKN